MTVSGTTIYELSRDSIIKSALRKIGALATGQTPTTEDYTNGQEALNTLVASFQNKGMQLWSRNDYSLTLTASTNTYTFGVGQTINTPAPLKILKMNLVNTSGGSAQEVFPIAKQDFNLLNTSSTGLPVNYTYQPFVNYGTLSLWPTPDATSASAYTVKITYQRPLSSFQSSADTPDFPQEWQLALIFGLAKILAPEYSVPLLDRQMLSKEAADALSDAMDGGAENSSFYFQIDRSR